MAAPVNTAAVTKQTDRQYTVESRSQPGMLHVVKRVNGRLSCDCDAAYNGQNCWHVASVAIVANADMKWERTKRAVISEETRAAALAMLMGRTV
jgi:hypothetical protein